MPRKKTLEEFKEQMILLKPEIDIIGDYLGDTKYIRCKCKQCQHEWDATPHNLIHHPSTKCPKCASITRGIHKTESSNKNFIERMSKINSNIEIMGIPRKAKDHIDVKCKICGHEWAPIQDSLLRGKGCPKCRNKKLSKDRMMPFEEFENRCKVSSPDVAILGEYTGVKKHIDVMCKKCGRKYNTIAEYLLQGCGCPTCSSSKGERQVGSILERYGINFCPQYTFDECKNIKPLPFDFYIPDYNVCIEYDGEQHFNPIEHFGGREAFQRRKVNDAIKTAFCENNNIRLIRIPYFMFSDVEDILFDELDIIEYLIDTSPLDYDFDEDFLF